MPGSLKPIRTGGGSISLRPSADVARALMHRQRNRRFHQGEGWRNSFAQIEAVLAKSRDLYPLIGECGDAYRR